MTEHLNESARAALELDDSERINRVRSSRWIRYTRAKQVLAKLESLLTHPKQHRMPNLLLVGDTNNGKTLLVNRFEKLHPEHEHPDGDRLSLPVLYIQAPPVPDEARFYNGILEKLGAPYRSADRIDRKQFQAIRILSKIETRILVIDELQHVLAGNLGKQRNFLNTIKYLGNELQIPIVGVGTKDAFNAIQTDPQLSNRFEPAILPRWEMNDEYLQLLASFERMLPLMKPSKLFENDLALKVLNMSEGTIGEISSLLGKAAVKAIETGGESISMMLIDSLDWTRPSERKWKASRRA
jgi:type II secretory pathway predicted ATPase ExeA